MKVVSTQEQDGVPPSTKGRRPIFSRRMNKQAPTMSKPPLPRKSSEATSAMARNNNKDARKSEADETQMILQQLIEEEEKTPLKKTNKRTGSPTPVTPPTDNEDSSHSSSDDDDDNNNNNSHPEEEEEPSLVECEGSSGKDVVFLFRRPPKEKAIDVTNNNNNNDDDDDKTELEETARHSSQEDISVTVSESTPSGTVSESTPRKNNTSKPTSTKFYANPHHVKPDLRPIALANTFDEVANSSQPTTTSRSTEPLAAYDDPPAKDPTNVPSSLTDQTTTPTNHLEDTTVATFESFPTATFESSSKHNKLSLDDTVRMFLGKVMEKIQPLVPSSLSTTAAGTNNHPNKDDNGREEKAPSPNLVADATQALADKFHCGDDGDGEDAKSVECSVLSNGSKWNDFVAHLNKQRRKEAMAKGEQLPLEVITTTIRPSSLENDKPRPQKPKSQKPPTGGGLANNLQEFFAVTSSKIQNTLACDSNNVEQILNCQGFEQQQRQHHPHQRSPPSDILKDDDPQNTSAADASGFWDLQLISNRSWLSFARKGVSTHNDPESSLGLSSDQNPMRSHILGINESFSLDITEISNAESQCL